MSRKKTLIIISSIAAVPIIYLLFPARIGHSSEVHTHVMLVELVGVLDEIMDNSDEVIQLSTMEDVLELLKKDNSPFIVRNKEYIDEDKNVIYDFWDNPIRPIRDRSGIIFGMASAGNDGKWQDLNSDDIEITYYYFHEN